MIAQCPKCYISLTSDLKPTLKWKGVIFKQNRDITKDYYKDIIDNGVKYNGQNQMFQIRNGQIARMMKKKTALSGVHNKFRECVNWYINPIIKNV